MTVRLLAAWGIYPANAIISIDSATETGLVAAKLADTVLTGGVAYVAPVDKTDYDQPAKLRIDPLTGAVTGLVRPDGSTIGFPEAAACKPVMILGGDHSIVQWVAGRGGMAQMYKDAGVQPYIAVNGAAVGVCTPEQLRSTGADLTNHGYVHTNTWTGNSTAGGANTGIVVNYTGANATGTVTISTTAVTFNDVASGNQVVTFSAAPTLAQFVTAVGALVGWTCTLDVIQTGTEPSVNLMQIASTTVTKGTAAKFASAGGIHMHYFDSAYKTVAVRKTTNRFDIFVDGVYVAAFDLTNVLYNTLAKLVAAINALSIFSTLGSLFECRVSDGIYAGSTSFVSGNELSVGLSDIAVTSIKNNPIHIQAGASTLDVCRRNLIKNKEWAAANGLTLTSSMQAGNAWFADLSNATADIHSIARGNSRGSPSGAFIPSHDHNGNHVPHKTFSSRQRTAFGAVASTDIFTLGRVWTLPNIQAGNPVVFDGPSLPAPLVAGTWYYPRDVVGLTFKLSATLGGAVLDITSDGSGFVECAFNLASRHTKALVDAMISTAENGGGSWTMVGLMHKLLADGTSPYGIVSDDNYHDQTEADYYDFLSYVKVQQDAGRIETTTLADWHKTRHLKQPVQSFVFNPLFVNSGDDLTKVTTNDFGLNIPGWGFTYPANWTACSVNGAGELTFAQNSNTSVNPIYQDLQLPPGEYEMSFYAYIDNQSAGGGISFKLASVYGTKVMNGLFSNTTITSAEYSGGVAGIGSRGDVVRTRFVVPETSWMSGQIWSATGPFDLSTNKNIRVNIDGIGQTADIDVSGVSPAATTVAEIAAKINTAIQGTAAYALRPEFWNAATVVDNRLVVRSPYQPPNEPYQQTLVYAGTALSALTTIFKVGALPALNTCVGFGFNETPPTQFRLQLQTSFTGAGRVSRPRIVRI